MTLKQKILFFNFMIFLVLFDMIYLVVWTFSIHMDPIKAGVVAGLTALLTPWARASHYESGKKVIIRSYLTVIYKKYIKKQY